VKTTLLFLAVLLAAPAAGPPPGDWPAWRGPTGSGSTTAGEYPTRWSPDDAAWKVALPGKGVSTPVVWKDRIYLTTPDDGQDAVLALDRDGKQAWLVRLGAESAPRHRSLASSCNASPVTDGKGVFTRFRSGRLAALELDGRVRWQVNLDERFGPEELFWDTGSSPVLTGNCVVISRMHHGESWVAGFDKQTGKQRWLQKRNYQTPSENDNGYTTPLLIQHQGRPALLLWGADHLTAHSAADGALLWSCGGFNPAGTVNWPAIASPVVHGGMAVVPVGRDDRPGQAQVHGIRLGGAGDVTATHRAWQRDDLGVFCCTPVEYEGRVYLLRHRGGVVCLDPATGKTIWENTFPRASGSFYSSPVIANGVLYAAREDGTVFAARVGEQFELLSENAMGERIVASPVPAGNCLLIRGDRNLFCIAARKP
jgi:outer membrane protein assembly factor BamB